MDLTTQLWNKGEGLRLKPYLDCCGKSWRDCTCEKKGKLTIGYGRNIDDDGITADEACFLRDNDLNNATRDAIDAFPSWYPRLGEARQAVVTVMVGAMGLPRFSAFKRMIAALEVGNFAIAADEIIDSDWAKEVGARATELAGIMRSGADGSGQ